MTREEVYAIVVRHTREVVPELEKHVFQPAEGLHELGANSMDRAEIVNLVLESLQLRVPRVELFGPRNIGELTELLHRKLHAR